MDGWTQRRESETRLAGVVSDGDAIGKTISNSMRRRRCGALKVDGRIKFVWCKVGGAMARYSSIGNSPSIATMSVSKLGTGICKRMRRIRSRCLSASSISSLSWVVIS